jgi:Zn-dependent peptidase ImmA (M78 family)
MRELKDILKIIEDFREKIPVDVGGLASALGISVKKVNFSGDVSGQLMRLGEDQFIISVNAHHSPTRQRFTIAHELAHFVLHRHLIGAGITDNCAYRAIGSTGNPNIHRREESEANKFAANLLMPADSIISLQNNGIEDTNLLARKLGVSPRAVEIRLGRDKVAHQEAED